MNKQIWNLYKDSERGKKCIELFHPHSDDIYRSCIDILSFTSKFGDFQIDENYILYWIDDFWANIIGRNLAPEKWTRDTYAQFIENLNILEPTYDDKGNVSFPENNIRIVLGKNEYRAKASLTDIYSLVLYYYFKEFKPVLIKARFDIFQRNCDLLGINLPNIPRSKNHFEYCMYYWDICETLNNFQNENGLSDSELCACVYDYATMLYEETTPTRLPKPTNVWFTGGSDGDFPLLDSLGKDCGENPHCIWACNEHTRRGDIVVMYCLSPRSYIHSIWRSNSEGIFNPFDGWHSRTSLCDGVLTPPITIKELKADNYMSQVPIVRRNLQGLNGIELSSKDYSELLRMIGEKGGDISKYPKLFEGSEAAFGDIHIEKDVEENILIPCLKKLGYSESDWTRQLSLKAGRKEKAIPDFVFFPQGEIHFESAPMVIEVKLDMSSTQEIQHAFQQSLSYARMLRSSIMGICDKERLILYQVDRNGMANRSNPIFENHWAAIYSDTDLGAELNHIIGREVIANSRRK